MAISIKKKTLLGLLWSSLERLGNRIVTLAFGVVLARLLSPDDYGIIAMPMVFLALASCLIDCGFSSALIRKTEVKEEDLNTAFFFNISIGVLCYITLWFTSPLTADFFHVHILEDVLRIIALTTIIGSLSSVHRMLLTREVEFKTLAKISLVSSVISGIVGIVMAFNGLGIWSLVVQSLVAEAVRTMVIWFNVPWRPRWIWANDSFKYLWGYGSKIMASSLINVISENVFIVVIGKFFAPASLGNFTKANSLASMPSLQATEVLQRVTYPILCKLQGDDEALAINYRKILKLSAFVVFPIMIGLTAAAKPFVSVLLGDQWGGVVIILQLLSLGMMLYPIHAINLNLLQTMGRSDLFLVLEVIKAIMGIVALIIAVPRGILWMATCIPVLSVLSLFVNTIFTGKMINLGLLKQLGDLFPIFLVSTLMGGCIFLFNIFVGNVFVQLTFDIALGSVIYLTFARLLLKSEWNEMIMIFGMIKNGSIG